MDSPVPARLISVNDAITYLGIKRSGLYRLINDGAIPSVRIGGRRLLDIHDLDAYIDQQKKVAQ